MSEREFPADPPSELFDEPGDQPTLPRVGDPPGFDQLTHDLARRGAYMPPLMEVEVLGDIPHLAEALAKAMGAMGAAKRDAENPFFDSTYASLASVVEVARKALADHGLAAPQMVYTPTEDKVGVRTRLMHETGEHMDSPILWVPVRNIRKDGSEAPITPQTIGSAITYARRYSLMAMLGIPAEDDDGNAASGKSGSGAKGSRGGGKKQQRKDTGEACSEAQQKMFYAVTRNLGYGDEEIKAGMERYGHKGKSFSDLTKTQASVILDALKKAQDAKKASEEQGDG
jgi:hypothetical protein